MYRLYSPLLILIVLSTSVSVSANTDPLIEEVIVKGELRDATLLEVANSISLFDAESILKRQATHLEDMMNRAPNVNYSSGASRGRFIQIRGIGERSQFTAPINPSVGIIVDGIDFTGIGTGVSTLDVDQIEVFRGPQGTLNGANALAGLINVHGASVADQKQVKLMAGAGNFNSHTASAIVNLPLSESFGWRAGLLQNTSDGFIENTFLNRSDTNNIDEKTFRNHLNWQLSGDSTVSLTSYIIDIDNGYDAFSLDSNSEDTFRTTLSDEPGYDRQETQAHAIKLTSERFNYVDVDATLSVAQSDLEYAYDEDWAYPNLCTDSGGCAFDGYSSFDSYFRENKNNTLDLRLLSKSEGDTKLSWVAGVYSRRQDVSLNRIYTFSDPYSSDYETRNTALYGQANIVLNDLLKLEVGMRTEDFSSMFHDSDQVQFTPDDTFFGGHATLKHKTANGLFYWKYSRGYKAGGFNPDTRVDREDRMFDSEQLNNLEYGYRHSSSDSKIQGEIVGFYQQRQNIQVKQSRGFRDGSAVKFIEFIDNAPNAKNYGIESQLAWLLSKSISVDANLGVLNTKYYGFFNNSHVDAIKNSDTGEVIGFDMSGRDQAHAPHYQYTAGIDWQVLSAMSLRVELEGKDQFYFSESHNTRSDSYNLVNASLNYIIDNVSITVWAKNIGDEVVETRGFFFGNDPRKDYIGESYTQKAAPRTFGIRTALEF